MSWAAWLGLVSLTGCGADCPLPGQVRTGEIRLFFGGSVPEAAWADFAAGVLTPAFPDGFTVFDAAGQWRDPQARRIVRERTRTVEVFEPIRAADIARVVASYSARFHQSSVGVVSGGACAAF